jgi:cardiolipin synthase
VRLELLQDAREFWPRAEADIRRAERRVLVQTLSLEGDQAGQALASALRASRAPERRVLIDSFTRHVVNDRFLHSPASLLDGPLRAEVRATRALVAGLSRAGIPVRFTSPAGPLLLRFPARDHRKLVLVDDRVAYLGGINFSEHNFAWRDLMLRIEHERAARFLAADFLRTFRGRPRASSLALPGLELHTFDGRSNARRFEQLLMPLVDAARARIEIEAPYLTQPFLERLVRAAERGVAVTVLTPEVNNFRLVRELLACPVATRGLSVRLYRGRMTHLKAILVDARTLVLGSANFDIWSYHFQGEHLAIVRDAELVRDFESRVLAAGLAGSRPLTRPASAWRGALARLSLRSLERASLFVLGG